MSRSKLPSSKTKLSRQVLIYDLGCGFFAPLLAYYVRDPNVVNYGDPASLLIYSGLSAVISLLSFMTFRIAQGLPRFFSFHDVIEIAKASFASVTVISAVLFSFTRLDDVPRSVPIIHFLLLAGMLIAGRMIRRSLSQRQDLGGARNATVAEEQAIVLVGVNRLAWFYVRILDTFALGHRRVVGLLDENQRLIGRSMFGHFVLGSPDNARVLLDDFASHGIPISAFVICEQGRERADALRDRLAPLAQERGIAIEMLARELGVEQDQHVAAPLKPTAEPELSIPFYLRLRRVFDAAASGLAIAILLPVLLLVAASVYFVLDAPVIFWQRRVGRDGRPIYVYKFRSMRNPVSATGRVLTDEERASSFGTFLRASRLDELPQLFNVLRGDMAIIGPRPLLPVDQPESADLRLSVPPGITGWAQIHGGKLVSVDEKNALDEFYVRNASLGLDARIVVKTLKTMLRGDRRDAALEKALDQGAAADEADIDPVLYSPDSRRVA